MRSGSVIDPTPTDEFLGWLYSSDRKAPPPICNTTEPFDILFDADFTAWMHDRGYPLARDVMTLEAMQRRHIADSERRRRAWAEV